MTAARRWARARRARTPKLRTQLVALLVALLTVAFALVAVATALALHTFLLDRLDQQLVAAGDRYSVGLEHPSDRDVDNDRRLATVSGQAAGTLGARVIGGRVTAAAIVGRDADDAAIGPGTAARAIIAGLRPTGSPTSVDLPRLGTYRMLAVRGDDGDVLVTGLPTEPIDTTIGRLILIEAEVFAVALALTTAGGILFVRIALRPLNRMADTATRVADLPLSSGTVSLPDSAPTAASDTEVGRLSHAFGHMLEHVESSLQKRERSEERLRRFIADASHELRTPVAVVRSHAEYAQRIAPDLPPDVVQSLGRIVGESERMGHLVDDLLLLARLDSGRSLAAEEVDVSRLVVDAVIDAQIAGSDHSWALDVPEHPVAVLGDEHALHQVLANLFANARTHTPPGTAVHTELRDLADRELVEIVITDDGPGIPEPVLADVFERFVRGPDSRSAGTGSSGLGLSIVRAIVQAHRGTVRVTSRAGRTSFTIRLPRWMQSEEEAEPVELDRAGFDTGADRR